MSRHTSPRSMHPSELEQIRRSAAMAPDVPSSTVLALLAEIERLRALVDHPSGSEGTNGAQ